MPLACVALPKQKNRNRTGPDSTALGSASRARENHRKQINAAKASLIAMPSCGSPQQPRQPALAVLDRLAPDVFAVHLEEVECGESRRRWCHGRG